MFELFQPIFYCVLQIVFAVTCLYHRVTYNVAALVANKVEYIYNRLYIYIY